jgi:predicted CXXCH cytochrome family protein
MRPFHVLSRAIAMGLLVAAVAWLGACTDTETKTVFVDRPQYNDPPDATNGFLGYYDAVDRQTTCGNCHVDHQADWANHGHSDAWQTLQASGHAGSSCVGCHTVSELGNAVNGPAGYNLVPDTVYYDVQCESCHGPGFEHVKTPDASLPPLASARADTGAAGSGTCAECHNGTHHPYTEQWRASRHADVYSGAISNASCQPCHEGRGALRAWGVTDNYIERNDVLTAANAMGTTCTVCHDPHGSENAGQLRFPIDDPTLENNLCMKCHARRFELTAANSGPHGPQGPVLLGTAGWWPPGYDTTPAPSSHGDPTVNTRLCAGCHVTRITVNDASGNFQLQSVGHHFRPIPCIDPATGEPLPGSSNGCAYNTTERNWTSCLGAGCHSNATSAAAALAASDAVTETLVDQIWVDVDGDLTVDFGTDGGYLAQVPSTEFVNNDNLITVAEGALFNAKIFGKHLDHHPDGSQGAHNPFLTQRILAASIQALKTQYGLPAPPASIQALVDRALAKGATPASLSRR